MKEVEWVTDDGKQSVTLHKVEEDTTVIVDGVATKVKKGTLLHPSGADRYWSVNQSDWKKAGLKPKGSTRTADPAKKTSSPTRKVASTNEK